MATVFTLSITCENEAFEPDDFARTMEVGRILHAVATRVENGHGDGPIRDWNGNHVGSYAFAETDDAADKIRDAAPEMLRALKRLRVWSDREHPDHDDMAAGYYEDFAAREEHADASKVTAELLADADAAIAKAEG
jgi:hypothetical protein